MQKPTLANFRAFTSLIESAVTATFGSLTNPLRSLRPTTRAYLSSGVALANTFNYIAIFLNSAYPITSNLSCPSLSTTL